MLDPKSFFSSLQNNGITFFTGVPDSLLKSIGAYIYDHTGSKNHVITANEGSAVALATGSFLATGNPALVYLQNSGLGNAINPLLSLADTEVYQIPMILMIGWRGEPGVKDEPQHVKQGRVQNELLDVMDIPYVVIDKDTGNYDEVLKSLVLKSKERSGPVALIVKKGTFSEYKPNVSVEEDLQLMSREEALSIIVDSLGNSDIIVSTTGKSSRELFEIRKRQQSGHQRDFLTVGSMGHCSHIALGIAIQKSDRKVYCIDGDGSIIMHMGSLSVIGQIKPKNYYHILINNVAHDSVGGQPTSASVTDLTQVAKACGYLYTVKVENEADLKSELSHIQDVEGPVFIEVKVKKGAREDLGRPTRTPIENRIDFEKFIRN